MQVDRKNEAAYAQLPGPELRLCCIDRCRLAEADRVADPDPGLLSAAQVTQELDGFTNARQQLKLKPQAQVGRCLRLRHCNSLKPLEP